LETNGLVGIGLLAIGICLLLFTFWCGYVEYLSVAHVEITSTDPWETFTKALGYFVEPCIKVMFLGIMGWVGVVLVSKGIQLMRRPPAPRPRPYASPPPPAISPGPSGPHASPGAAYVERKE